MKFLIFLLTLSITLFSHSQKYFVDQSEVSFYSWAPLEDISAVSNNLEGVVDLNNGNFFFQSSNFIIYLSFVFDAKTF